LTSANRSMSGGTTYELKDISKDGQTLKVAKSDKTVAEEAVARGPGRRQARDRV